MDVFKDAKQLEKSDLAAKLARYPRNSTLDGAPGGPEENCKNKKKLNQISGQRLNLN